VVELLTDLLADADARAAATAAALVRLGQVVHDPLARQVRRQRLATVAGSRPGLISLGWVAWHARPPGLTALRALAEVQAQGLVEAVPQLLVLLTQPADLGQQLLHQLLERGRVAGQRQVGVGQQCFHAEVWDTLTAAVKRAPAVGSA